MPCFCRRFRLLFQNMAKIVLEKVAKELKYVKLLLQLGIGSLGDRYTKLFISHKPCYNGQ